jgi:hypothetical protein
MFANQTKIVGPAIPAFGNEPVIMQGEQFLSANQIIRVDMTRVKGSKGEDNPGFNLIVSPLDRDEWRKAMLQAGDMRWWFPTNPPKLLLWYGSAGASYQEAYIDVAAGGFYYVPGSYLDVFAVLGVLPQSLSFVKDPYSVVPQVAPANFLSQAYRGGITYGVSAIPSESGTRGGANPTYTVHVWLGTPPAPALPGNVPIPVEMFDVPVPPNATGWRIMRGGISEDVAPNAFMPPGQRSIIDSQVIVSQRLYNNITAGPPVVAADPQSTWVLSRTVLVAGDSMDDFMPLAPEPGSWLHLSHFPVDDAAMGPVAVQFEIQL